MALAALLPLLPLTNARHLHDQLALASYEDSSSDDSLPKWQPNPFHGLDQSNYDSSSSSDSSSDNSNININFSDSSSDNDNRDYVESESSYEEITQAALQAAMREIRRQRIRHRRSHNLHYFIRSQHEALSAPNEWENPCGGDFRPNKNQATSESDNSSRGNVIKRKYLIALRNKTMREYENVKQTTKLDYGSYDHWQHEYEFLPNMTRPTNTVKLKTWYRHVQTFVGSFAHLGKAHYKYRKENQLSIDDKTNELHSLLLSARRVLCEIETTINSSYPTNHSAKLSHVTKDEMNERLKFHTPSDGSKEADIRDLKFTKELYHQYLNNMWRTLQRALRKPHSKERKHYKSRSGSTQTASSESQLRYSLKNSESGSIGATSAADEDTNRIASKCNNSDEC